MQIKRGIDRVFEAITGLLMMTMAALTLLQVVSRYAFHAPFPWTEELARINLIYLTFLGSIVAFQRKDHLKLELVVHALSPLARRWLRIVVDIASMLVLGVVVWQGAPLLEKFWTMQSAALSWPTTVFYFPVVLGCFVMMIYTGLDIIEALRDSSVGRGMSASDQEVAP